ncbi:adenosine deaminase [Alteromonas sp. KUL49]|uniref:adenosine deaminase n=1 Tax=Alteromonas sp. KUL49 TaxID=2480798 RepID=UPI00102ED948|nr:adenosine deaminase [Alteromonas sp. KUL49]TAP40233.1 adenosine deaminase [Alteromonas sp. KUL49]GEA11365.1 hypothetical protein KUL49_17400 [Alteromonas sp. KUL49]
MRLITLGIAILALTLSIDLSAQSNSTSDAFSMNSWFRAFKQNADAKAMHSFLVAMPKGGDLHHHLSGAGLSEWWFELASDPNKNGGYHYYTKVSFSHCEGYGSNEFGPTPQYMMFHTVSGHTWDALSDCQKSEYKRLDRLTAEQIAAFQNSIRLDKPHEGRDEFFERHWRRLGEMTANPTLMANILLKNMQAYAQENVQYLETQVNLQRATHSDGTPYTPEEALAVYEALLNSEEALETQVEVRFQYALLRFLPNAEQQLAWMYEFVDTQRQRYVGINMVGREDNDKGYPLRFLSTLREMRKRYPRIPLAIHAGESDEPNYHVRDTLLIGADRIGHGFNTITDPETLLLMRNGPYLIESNLISNLLLEYVDNFNQHPFPEYLRLGIPVALSTDDRGMWDSTLSDEFFIAVTHFNLSWDELLILVKNSISYSFLSPSDKAKQLEALEKNMSDFVAQIQSGEIPQRNSGTYLGQFICGYEPAVCE